MLLSLELELIVWLQVRSQLSEPGVEESRTAGLGPAPSHPPPPPPHPAGQVVTLPANQNNPDYAKVGQWPPNWRTFGIL